MQWIIVCNISVISLLSREANTKTPASGFQVSFFLIPGSDFIMMSLIKISYCLNLCTLVFLDLEFIIFVQFEHFLCIILSNTPVSISSESLSGTVAGLLMCISVCKLPCLSCWKMYVVMCSSLVSFFS